jgi:hypothetical protein
MLYRIEKAVAHADHTVTITWSHGVEAMVDLGPIVAKGKVFAALQDASYFVERMRAAADRLGLEWPNRIDFSADGLRLMAFPKEGEEEFGLSTAKSAAPHRASRP